MGRRRRSRGSEGSKNSRDATECSGRGPRRGRKRNTAAISEGTPLLSSISEEKEKAEEPEEEGYELWSPQPHDTQEVAETRLYMGSHQMAPTSRQRLMDQEAVLRQEELKSFRRKSRHLNEEDEGQQDGADERTARHGMDGDRSPIALFAEEEESSEDEPLAGPPIPAAIAWAPSLHGDDELSMGHLFGSRPGSVLRALQAGNGRDLTVDELMEQLQRLPEEHLFGMKGKLKLRQVILEELERHGETDFRLNSKRPVKKRDIVSAWRSLLPFSRSIYIIESTFGTDVASYYRMMRWLILTSVLSALIIIAAIVVPQVSASHYRPPAGWYRALWGEGTRNESLIFYGAYQPIYLNGYYIPYAYFVVMFVYFMIQLLVLVHELAPRLNADKHLNPLPVSSIFLTWDYKVRGEKDADTHRSRFKNSMRAALTQGQTRRQTKALLLWRAFTFAASMAAVAGVWFGIDRVNRRYANSEDGVEALLPALTLAVVNAAGPTIFWRLARTVEMYSALWVLKISLMRSFLLRIVSLYVIFTSLFGLNLDDMELAQERCWETLIGQEIYRVLLVDTGFSFVTSLLYDTPRHLIFEYGSGYALFDLINKNLGPPQFFLTSSFLGGIYRQTLIWLGTFYCPLLPLLGAALNIILVFGKGIAMFRLQRPSQKAFDLQNFKQLYVALLLLSVLLSLSPVVYSLANLTPSRTCGPFREYDDISSVVSAMIDDAPWQVQRALSTLGQPTVIVPLVFILLITTYYFFRKSQLQSARFVQAQRLAADTHDAFKVLTHMQRSTQASSNKRGDGGAGGTGGHRALAVAN